MLLKDTNVVIGEMGSVNKNNTQTRNEWAKYYIEMLENSIYGIIEILITKKEAAEVFGYFYRDSLRWDDDEAIDLHIAYSSLLFEDIDTNEVFQT